MWVKKNGIGNEIKSYGDQQLNTVHIENVSMIYTCNHGTVTFLQFSTIIYIYIYIYKQIFSVTHYIQYIFFLW